MSSRRSRSGGSSISIVFRRNSRSWRKRFSSASLSVDTLVAATTRTSIGTGLFDADRDDLALLERGQQLGLQMKRQIPDLVEEQGALVGGLEPPDAIACRTGERAFDVTEQLGFEQGLAGRAEVDGDHRHARPRRDSRWISRATISLPVPFSPRISTLASVGAARSISVRTRSIAGDLPSSGVSVGRRQLGSAAALGPRIDPAPAKRGGAPHRRRQALVAPRLGDEIAGAGLQRFDGDRHRPVSGDDHHRRVGILAHDPAEEARALRGRRSPPRSKLRSSRMASGLFFLSSGSSRPASSASRPRSNMSRSASRAASAISGSSSTTTARLNGSVHATSVARLSGNEQ